MQSTKCVKSKSKKYCKSIWNDGNIYQKDTTNRKTNGNDKSLKEMQFNLIKWQWKHQIQWKSNKVTMKTTIQCKSSKVTLKTTNTMTSWAEQIHTWDFI